MNIRLLLVLAPLLLFTGCSSSEAPAPAFRVPPLERMIGSCTVPVGSQLRAYAIANGRTVPLQISADNETASGVVNLQTGDQVTVEVYYLIDAVEHQIVTAERTVPPSGDLIFLDSDFALSNLDSDGIDDCAELNLFGDLDAIDSILPDTERKWRAATGDGTVTLKGSPAIDQAGNIIDTGSNDEGLPSRVTAFQTNGEELWSWTDELTGGRMFRSPTIDDNGVIYTTVANMNGGDGGALLALDASGNLLWTFPADAPASSVGNARTTPSIAADGTIVFGTHLVGMPGRVTLYALNPDGSVIWDWESPDTPISIEGKPAIHGNRVYVASRDTGALYAVQLSSGADLWQTAIGQTDSSPAIDFNGNIVIGADDGKVYSVNPVDGAINWTFQTDDVITSSAVIDDNNNIYIKSEDRYLYSLAPDGSERWRFKTATGAFSNRFQGRGTGALAADGILYIGEHSDGNSRVLGIDSTTGKPVTLGDNGASNSMTIGSDGTLYYRFFSDFVAVEGTARLSPTAAWPKYGRDIRNRGRL